MKHSIQIIIIFCLLISHEGCNSLSEPNRKENNVENTVAERLLNENYKIYEKNISLHPSEKPYKISVIPYKDSTSDKYATKINLWNLKDTIFIKNINIDSLINTIIKHDIHSEDSIRIEKLREYNLVHIIPEGGWRAGYTYFTAKLESENKQKDIFIQFGIKYEDEIGNLWVGAFYFDDKDLDKEFNDNK